MNNTAIAVLALAGLAVVGFFGYKAVEASQSSKLLETAQTRTTGEKVGGALETLISAGRGLFGE